MSKVISKKKQIEIIIDGLQQYVELENKINEIFEGTLDKYAKVFNIGYEVIPAMLGVPYTNNYGDNHEIIGELVYNYAYGKINKKTFFDKINEFLKED